MPAIRRNLALVALIGFALPLTACSSLGAGSGSEEPASGKTADASGSSRSCAAAVDTIHEVMAEAQQSAPQLIDDLLSGNSVDPGAFVEPVLTSLDAAGSGASDPAIAEAIEDARVEWDGLATDIQGLGTPDLSGIDLGDLGSLGELGKLQTYGEDLSAIVSTRLPALQETGAALQKACATPQ